MVKKLIRSWFGNNNAEAEKKAWSVNEDKRVEWLEKTLQKIPAGGKILDAGAGEQQFKKFCTHLNYVSQDFAQYDPKELEKGLQMKSWDYGKLDLISDIASIPVENESFDAVMCTEVFEHIINPREAIKEFSRVLKSKGYLVITAPFCSLTHFAPYHFYTGFNKYFYENELQDNNFEVIEISRNGNYFDYLAQEIVRIPSMSAQYSDVKNTEQKALSRVLALLQEASETNKNSEELLCFGYHILAQKK